MKRGSRFALACVASLGLLAAACTAEETDTESTEAAVSVTDAPSSTVAPSTDPTDTATTDTATTDTAATGDTTPAELPPLEGSTTGITDDTIKIGYLGADFGDLAAVGLAPELGDQPAVMQALVDDINANGGIAGRQIELKVEMYPGLSTAEQRQAACLSVTQDFGAAVVVIGASAGRDLVTCVSVVNETLTLGVVSMDKALFAEAEGRLFSSLMSWDRVFLGLAQGMGDEGLLDGRTVGVVSSESRGEVNDTIESVLIPALEAGGAEVPEFVVLPCPDGDNDCEQHEAAIQRLKDAEVEVVVNLASPTGGPVLVQAAANLGYEPQWATAGEATTKTVGQFYAGVPDAWNGAFGVSAPTVGVTTDQGLACLEVLSAAGLDYAPADDAAGFSAGNCGWLVTLQRAGEIAGPELNQATLIRAIESLGEIPTVYEIGTVSADQHDVANALDVADFDASAGQFVFRNTPFDVE